jgi:hypothetical protein
MDNDQHHHKYDEPPSNRMELYRTIYLHLLCIYHSSSSHSSTLFSYGIYHRLYTVVKRDGSYLLPMWKYICIRYIHVWWSLLSKGYSAICNRLEYAWSFTNARYLDNEYCPSHAQYSAKKSNETISDYHCQTSTMGECDMTLHQWHISLKDICLLSFTFLASYS